MNFLLKLCNPLVILASLNWGLVGAFNYNAIDAIFSGRVENIIYIVFGVAGLLKALGVAGR